MEDGLGPLRMVEAGRKRLALLRECVVTAGQRGSDVMIAVFGPGANSRLAAGWQKMSPGLCDALIELMVNLPIDVRLQEVGDGPRQAS